MMDRKFAQRLDNLGTETAYAVAEEAAVAAKNGIKVLALHIGDINLPTPKCVKDECKRALDEGKTGYCPASGVLALKEAMAEYISNTRGVKYSKDEISIQPGGKPVIQKFLTCVMEPGDEVLYPTPGYPIYESQINFLGGVGKPYTFKDTDKGFHIDMDYLKSLITNKTKILIYNNYQNPIGCVSSDEEMAEIAQLCVKHDLWVLADEAYFNIVYEPLKPKSIVSFPGMVERTVILHTFSKEFSMTGWRLGAAIGPKQLISYISKLNTNSEACTTHFVQYAGMVALKHPEAHQFTKDLVNTLKERRDALVPLVNQIPGFKSHTPQATFYLFINVTEALKMKNVKTLEEFRKLALKETGVSFCTREHFGVPLPFETNKYIRFAYASLDIPQMQEACLKLKNWMSQSQKGSE